MTLTLKTVPREFVVKQLDKMIACFRRLRQRKIWNDVGGMIASIEILKEKDDLWYVHCHVLMDAKWIDQKELSETWKKITGDSFVVWVERVSNTKDALREVLKYQTKIWELSEEDKWFVENTLKNRRFIIISKIKRPKKLDRGEFRCDRPGCHGKMVCIEPFHGKHGGRESREEREYFESCEEADRIAGRDTS